MENQNASKTDIIEYIQFIRETERLPITKVEFIGQLIPTGLRQCPVANLIEVYKMVDSVCHESEVAIEGHTIHTDYIDEKTVRSVTLQLRIL